MKYVGAITLDIMGNMQSSRADCSCGWRSPYYKSQMAALEAGQTHAKLEHGVTLKKCWE